MTHPSTGCRVSPLLMPCAAALMGCGGEAYPTNDTALGYSIDKTPTNQLKMRAAAQSGGAVVVLSTQPPALSPQPRTALALLDAWLAAQVDRCFVPLRDTLAAGDGTLDRRRCVRLAP